MEKIVKMVTTESMKPTLFRGDKVACIKVSLDDLYWWGGYIHYLEFKDGQTTIRRVYDEGENIKIKCDGVNGSSQMIPKKYVQAIYRVIASARTYG